MQNIRSLQFHAGSREELLPGFSPDFPYISSRAEIHRYEERFVPWHWHAAVELFYLERGALEYRTTGQRILFPEGSAGFVNSGILHMTRPVSDRGDVVQLLHIFSPSLVAGEPGGRIERRYVLPVTISGAEILAFLPDEPRQERIIRRIREAFQISPREPGYELFLREALSRIWMELYQPALSACVPLSADVPLSASGAPSSASGAPLSVSGAPAGRRKADHSLKIMIAHIQEHFAEKLSVSQIAASASFSERECYRIFQEALHVTPSEYLKSCRLQAACRMLSETAESVTAVGYACGLGSASHFGKVFREALGCTPSEYRAKWQNRDIFRR